MSEQIECGHCATEVDADETVETVGGVVCEDCLDNAYSTCEDCGDIVDSDDIEEVAGSTYVCGSCVDNYPTCTDCSNRHHSDDMRWTLHDETVCDYCADYNYSYCEDCDGLYHHDTYDEHQHGECSENCESPVQHFRIRNGDGMLANDERVTIDLPAGFLSDEGIGAISRLIRQKAPQVPYDLYTTDPEAYSEQHAESVKWLTLSYRLDEIGPEWSRKDGNYTKRLSKFAYKEFGIKVTPDILTEVGNIGRQHSEGAELSVEITRDLNLPAEDFAHADSCWWQSYSSSRCALKTNGGFGLRTFGQVMRHDYDYTTQSYKQVPAGYEGVTGRAWVMPLKMVDGNLSPTFETEEAAAFVVFNGYGDLSGYAPARTLAGMVGMTYRKVQFSADPMYVNNDSGYLVAPESIASQYDTDGRIFFDLDQHSNLHYFENRTLANA